MRTQNGGIKVKSFVYDFAKDGGAISTIKLKEFIPDLGSEKALVIGCHTRTIAQVTSAGAAEISFGVVGSVAAFQAATVLAGFTTGAIQRGKDLDASPILISSGDEAVIAISVAAVTAGKVEVFVEYIADNM